MAVEDEIHARLWAAFEPAELSVVNDSARHAGHAGDDGTGETHFKVRIAAAAFADMTRVARHRAVHDALGAELIGRIHALALDIRVPG